MFGRPYRQFLAARAVSCRHTLCWTPFSQCSLATSGRCAANNLFIYSSRTRYSCLLSAYWSCRYSSARNEKGLRNALRFLAFHVGGANASLWLRLCHACWTSVLQNVGGSEWVRSQKRLGAWRRRIGAGCMNLVTAISRSTWVPVTLRPPSNAYEIQQCSLTGQSGIARAQWGLSLICIV